MKKDEPSSQILNQKMIYAYNEDEEIIIKTRFYELESDKFYNNIKSINIDKLNYYFDEYGNSESLFYRWKSNNLNYYGFSTCLVFDLPSEYYLYFKQYYGNLNLYKYQIDD